MLTCNTTSEYNVQFNGISPGNIATTQATPFCELQADGSCYSFRTLNRSQDSCSTLEMFQ